MAGATVSPMAAAGVVSRPDFASNGQSPSTSSANSQRISLVVERLLKVLDSTSQTNSSVDIIQLCLALARGIDYAVANNDIPSKTQELPILLRKVCQRKNDQGLQPGIMVLMISVKAACTFQWFTDNDTEELLTLTNELRSSFSSQGNINAEQGLILPIVLNVMARFCPQIKTGQIYASVQINPGYDAYLVDFHIPKNHNGSAKDTIRLFVAQTDDVETSSCLISPLQVSFLLNGKGVVKRTNAVMGTSPLMPTDVTSMLKYGPNLLQALGQFNGHYLVVIASMTLTSMPETSALPEYVPLAVAAQDDDADIIEGRSRISLNCPISCKRIKTPAKGQSCKHLKSFDLGNFLNLNIKTLSWRCPHCGQNTSYQDIRIDQDMAKILREVGENVADVIINEDGSWKPGTESNGKKDGSDPQETTTCTDANAMIHDLTEEDDEMDVMILYNSEDRKPFQANARSQATDAIIPINKETAAPIDDDFWTGIHLPTVNPMRSDAMSDVQTAGHISEMLPEEFRGNTPSLMQNQFIPFNSLQLHPSQAVNCTMSNEYGSLPSLHNNINVTRTPVAVQALPAQFVHSVPGPRPRTSLNSMPPNTSALPTSYGLNTTSNGTTEGRHHYSIPNMSPRQVSEMTSPLLQHRASSQMNTGQRDHMPVRNHPAQQAVYPPVPTQLPGSSRQLTRTEQQNAPQQQSINQRITQNINYPPNSMTRTPPHLQRTQPPQIGLQPNVGHTHAPVSSNPYHYASHRTGQMARNALHTPVQMQSARPATPITANSTGFRSSAIGVPVQSVTTTEDLMNTSPDTNWRPSGRMRGSLSGQAYSAALSQYMTQPVQQTQVTRPLANQTSVLTPVPPHLQVLLANNRNAHASPTHNSQPNGPDNMTGNLGVSPHQAL